MNGIMYVIYLTQAHRHCSTVCKNMDYRVTTACYCLLRIQKLNINYIGVDLLVTKIPDF